MLALRTGQRVLISLFRLLSPGVSPRNMTVTSMAGSERCLILEHIDGKIYRITLDREKKKNALTMQMYKDFTTAMQNASKSDATLTVIAAKGEYFCTGTDLSSTLVQDSASEAGETRIFLECTKKMRFVATFIDHPKPLIGVVQGPAYGIGVTILGLFDAVYASDRATFTTPFTSLGVSAEGCSSYTFPRLMGNSKASDVLLFGTKLSAEEALRYRLVSDVFPDSTFSSEVERRLKRFAEFPPESLQLSKMLMRGSLREELHRVNTAEMKLIEETWDSAERRAAVQKFVTRKSKI